MTPNSVYAELIVAANQSASSNEIESLNRVISGLGMMECEAEDYKFKEINTAYELVYGDERVFVQYRWYDTSKAFSIRPDMNVYLFRHIKDSKVIAEDEIRFLDRS
jgi:hypothetical protein